MNFFNFATQSPFIVQYKIADEIYFSQKKLLFLEPLIQSQVISRNTIQDIHTNHNNRKNNIFHQDVLIDDNSYALCVDVQDDGSYLLQSDEEDYFISQDQIVAKQDNCDNNILLGPVLILNLAINNVFCLHASAFVLNNKVFIFMGESGTGKSTVARFVHQHANAQRLTDDILPLKIMDNKITLLPCFPQLKLSQEQQYSGDNIVKDTVLLFAQKSNESTELHEMDNFSAMKKMIKHSVASKLFADKELQNHLNFCQQVSQLASSYQVNYQHSEGGLNTLWSCLNEIQ